MKHLSTVALALAIMVTTAAAVAADDGKPATQAGVSPNVPTGCVDESNPQAWYQRYAFVGNHTFRLRALARWCYNSNHVITSITDTWVGADPVQDPLLPHCRTSGTDRWRYSGGVGYTWYTTDIIGWFTCDDGHGHGAGVRWAHNGWGNSGVVTEWSW